MIITILSIFILLVLGYYYYVHNGRNVRIINLIPGPPSYPIFGNMLQFSGLPEEQWKVLNTLIDHYYPIFKIWVSFTPVVFIRHPDDLKTILSSTKHMEKKYDVLHSWMGSNTLTLKGVKWYSRRKMFVPTFHFNILQQFVAVLIEEGVNMTKALKNTECPIVQDLVPFVSEHTLNALCETVMGVSLRDHGAFQQQYREAIHQIGELCVYRIMRQWLHNDWIFSLTPKGKEQEKVLKILHGFTAQIIKERKLYHKCTNDRFLESTITSAEANDAQTIKIPRRRLALLDLLIAASRKGLLTDTEVKEEIDGFMFGGHDTTAMSLSFLLALLAEHKDIQDRVRNEIHTVMKENGGKFTTKSLGDLSHLDRCIKEALRLYPSASLISRVTGEDVKLRMYLTNLLLSFTILLLISIEMYV